ncbi:MAG: hypothetical protein WC974_08940 [Thermoplasmata archaeon]
METENKVNTAEEVVIPETSVVVEEKPVVVEKQRGAMGDMINRYKDSEINTMVTKEELINEKPEFDYSFFKDLGDDDYKKYENLKATDEALYHDILSTRNDMKKNQRLVSAREVELGKAKETSVPKETIEKHNEFFSGLKKDFFGTYKQYQSELGLPDLEYVSRQIETGGDTQSRLQQWQANDLTQAIEKKFKLDEGDFVYDPADAYKSNTPSYEYRIMTEKKEKAFQSEYENEEAGKRNAFEKITQEREKDLQFLKETYFKESDEEFVAFLGEMDSMAMKMKEGNFSSDANPFALRNLFRGVHFDKLIAKSNTELANKIHQEYNAKGMFLPSNGKDKFIDSTKVQGAATITNDNGKPMFGGMSRSMRKYRN